MIELIATITVYVVGISVSSLIMLSVIGMFLNHMEHINCTSNILFKSRRHLFFYTLWDVVKQILQIVFVVITIFVICWAFKITIDRTENTQPKGKTNAQTCCINQTLG